MMQVLYSTALERGFKGINGDLRPRYLFDLPEHVKAGGGTVVPGANHLGSCFLEYFPAATGSLKFASIEKWTDHWITATSKYNGLAKDETASDYGKDAVVVMEKFSPALPVSPIN